MSLDMMAAQHVLLSHQYLFHDLCICTHLCHIDLTSDMYMLFYRTQVGEVDHSPTSADCHDWFGHYLHGYWRIVIA